MSEYCWPFYLLGEQHGFHQAENIKFSLDGEFYFYSRVFGFDAHDIDVDVSHIIVVINFSILKYTLYNLQVKMSYCYFRTVFTTSVICSVAFSGKSDDMCSAC